MMIVSDTEGSADQNATGSVCVLNEAESVVSAELDAFPSRIGSSPDEIFELDVAPRSELELDCPDVVSSHAIFTGAVIGERNGVPCPASELRSIA